MSKKKENGKTIENVEQTLTNTEQFLEQNYKPLLYGLISIVVIVGLFWLFRMYSGKKNEEAQSQMFMAEKYFSQDSLKLALNGDGNNLGFINFYAGTCLMHLGQFEEALDYLNKYTLKDEILAPEAKGLIGDANVELGDKEAGVKYYLEAADLADNSFHTPIYLMKAGIIYESEGKYAEALKLYERIQDKYIESNEGRSIDKYIARVKMQID
jgi:tetratricopeptide (TPR) repeat protein